VPKILLRRLPDAWRPPDLDVCKGSNREVQACPLHVCFTPNSGRSGASAGTSEKGHKRTLRCGRSAADRACRIALRYAWPWISSPLPEQPAHRTRSVQRTVDSGLSVGAAQRNSPLTLGTAARNPLIREWLEGMDATRSSARLDMRCVCLRRGLCWPTQGMISLSNSLKFNAHSSPHHSLARRDVGRLSGPFYSQCD
jgi:hypothetical protein